MTLARTGQGLDILSGHGHFYFLLCLLEEVHYFKINSVVEWA